MDSKIKISKRDPMDGSYRIDMEGARAHGRVEPFTRHYIKRGTIRKEWDAEIRDNYFRFTQCKATFPRRRDALAAIERALSQEVCREDSKRPSGDMHHLRLA